MKIALLTDGITPYVIGGMQKHSYYLAKFFARNKVYVDLFHFNKSDLNINNLDVFSEEEKLYINAIVIEFPKLDSLPGHYIRESYRYSELIFESIKNKLNDYNFIYSKGFTAWKLIEEKKRGLSCPPIGVKFHGYEMFQTAPDLKTKLQHFLLRKPVKWVTKNADFVFSYGGKINEIILKLGVPSIKIIENSTAIEENWVRKTTLGSNTVCKFIFVGRYERRKGIEELTLVIKSLLGKKFTFDFIGPIPENKKIKSDQIIYHGSISNTNKIQEILQKADVLVCPSYSEGMPNVILEGMASGLAIIATDVGAVGKMVDQKNGILINSCNEKILRKALIDMLELDKEQLIKRKKNSIEKVEREFLWQKSIEKLIEKLNQI